MTEKFKPKPFDSLILLLTIIIGVFPFFINRTESGNHYRVIVEDSIIAQGELAQDSSFTVEGAIGAVSVKVESDFIEIIESNCPHGYCMTMGKTNSSLKPIVCIPNKLIIEIESKETEEFDAIIK